MSSGHCACKLPFAVSDDDFAVQNRRACGLIAAVSRVIYVLRPLRDTDRMTAHTLDTPDDSAGVSDIFTASVLTDSLLRPETIRSGAIP